jgi:hypothetical protein
MPELVSHRCWDVVIRELTRPESKIQKRAMKRAGFAPGNANRLGSYVARALRGARDRPEAARNSG